MFFVSPLHSYHLNVLHRQNAESKVVQALSYFGNPKLKKPAQMLNQRRETGDKQKCHPVSSRLSRPVHWQFPA